ncbi:hypothetical protein GCM10009740_32690 [Terrabacter terrae]|uniref:Chaplin domain-containing protein n=1 Tax=Terrabacter terrae TaxID=318434 RepID=A0ABN2UKY5_9MICO
MHAYVRRGLYGTLTAGGLLLLGAVGASADTTTGDHGVASGTQVVAPVHAPVSVDGNAVAVLGHSSTTQARPASGTGHGVASGARGPRAATSGTRGVGSGTQGVAPVSAPVAVEGNAVSVLGRSSSTKSTTNGSSNGGPSGAPAPRATTSGARGLASGTQLAAPVSAPISVRGNAVSVLGRSSTTQPGADGHTAGGSSTAQQPAATSGRGGIASGTQAVAPVNAPVVLGGNAVAVLGTSSVTGDGTGAAAPGPGAGDDPASSSTSGIGGLLSGTQLVVPVNAPVSAEGNSVSVLGDSQAASGSGASPGGDVPAEEGGLGSAEGEDQPGEPAPDTPESPETPASPEPAGSEVGGVGGVGHLDCSTVEMSVPGAGAGAAWSTSGGLALRAGASTAVAGDSWAEPDATGPQDTGAGAPVSGTGGLGGVDQPTTPADPCAANIALSSAGGHGVTTAGIGSGDLGATAVSALLLMLLAASLAGVIRRRGTVARR